MITAPHTLVYSEDPPAARAFFTDVLRWPFVNEGSSDPADWLIFRSGPSELGVHPTSEESHGWSTTMHHEISLMCDDLTTTMDELRSHGATFTSEPADRGFGICVTLAVPRAEDILLYEPRHTVAHSI